MTVTGVYTPVETTTNVIVSSTSLPHSLDTVTTAIVVSSTSQSVYTTNTLNNMGSSATNAAAATTTTAASAAGAGMVTAGVGVGFAALMGAVALL
ncbi:hypothetical protein LTR05_005890 [Lithohypha guttulata]|uniref:Uncharacterized protein n=2 Tax=Lithohypha guttulata TaxID=1690604 RepID=A0AAN7SZL8_9EURO|nr:hypothetical protein LTR05_005890 [Lithohypha guttulata]